MTGNLAYGTRRGEQLASPFVEQHPVGAAALSLHPTDFRSIIRSNPNKHRISCPRLLTSSSTVTPASPSWMEPLIRRSWFFGPSSWAIRPWRSRITTACTDPWNSPRQPAPKDSSPSPVPRSQWLWTFRGSPRAWTDWAWMDWAWADWARTIQPVIHGAIGAAARAEMCIATPSATHSPGAAT